MLNVSLEIVERMLKVCEDKGLPKPSCYQGDYKFVTRGMETKLLPILRAHNITYNTFRYINLPVPTKATFLALWVI